MNLFRILCLSLVLFLLPFMALYAHIGSPGVIMQGKAGPYELVVQVEPPDVIPGIAKVVVYTADESITEIYGRAIYYRTGDEGAPKPDKLAAMPNQPGQYAGDIWMMVTGSSSVQLQVQGSQGKGEMVVPVVAVSTATRTMPPSKGFILAGLAIFLVVLLSTIIGVSVADGLTPPGETVDARRWRNRRWGFLIGLLAALGILYAGNVWWQSWATRYQRFMYQPLQANTILSQKEDAWHLRLTIDTTGTTSLGRYSNFNFLVPDHGKIMHMFIMRIPSMDAFAHLHPQRIDSLSFTSILPSLPKGKYLVFADIVYLSGFSETIKDTFDLAQDIADHHQRLDPDDAYAFALPANLVDASPPPGEEENFFICGKPGTGVRLKDGSTMVWEGQKDETMYAGRLYNLQFAVYEPSGKPATLNAYLGMSGHAAVIRNDGNVYIHMHPSGTANMAATQVLANRIADTVRLRAFPTDGTRFRDSVDAWLHQLYALPSSVRDSLLMTETPYEHTATNGMVMEGQIHNHMLQFPYVFPTGGQYRIWVQVKRKGQVLTAAFDKWID